MWCSWLYYIAEDEVEDVSDGEEESENDSSKDSSKEDDEVCLCSKILI